MMDIVTCIYNKIHFSTAPQNGIQKAGHVLHIHYYT